MKVPYRDQADMNMDDAHQAEIESGGGGLGGILPSVEMQGGASQSHTGYLFDIKSDPDARSSNTSAKPSLSSPAPTVATVASNATTNSAKISKSAPRKKGTAANKKIAPKRPKSMTAKLKIKNQGTTDGQDGSSKDPNAPTIVGGSPSEADNGPYCICRGPDDHRWMIGCEICEDWFHGECINLDKEKGEKLIERFVCPNCTDMARNKHTKYKKTCSLLSCTNPARLYLRKERDRSVFCSGNHCDEWWASLIQTLPTRKAAEVAVEVLTQEDFVGLLVGAAKEKEKENHKGGWHPGDKPFGNMTNLWSSSGLPTCSGVLSDEEQNFLQASAAERLALGNEIVQYKKMMQLVDWGNTRRAAAVESAHLPKDACGYDFRLDVVAARHAFAAWLESKEGGATFEAGRLLDESFPGENGSRDEKMDGVIDGEEESGMTSHMCEKKRCKAHTGWYKILMTTVRNLMKEAAAAAAEKLEREQVLRQEAEVRYERLALEKNWVEVLDD